MPDSAQGLLVAFCRWFHEQSAQNGHLPTLRRLLALLWEFLRDSLPSRRRQRYGDVDFDWDHHVDTTAATVGPRDRLLGLLHSPYQPTDPALFHEMLASLKIDFRDYVFIDIGSGKGRVLLMAAEYPFKRVIGVELLPELNRIAQQNIAGYTSNCQQCFSIGTHWADAREFVFPPEPLMIYLFNPLPEAGLMQLMSNLERSLRENPQPVFVLYHNPLLVHVLTRGKWLRKIGGTHRYSIFAADIPREAGLSL
jgi:SAM-dependent methyltransferase